MQSKKIIIIFALFILLFSFFSGCIIEDLFSRASSYNLKNWYVTESEGFPSVFLEFETKEKTYLRTYDNSGEILDWEFFYDKDDTILNIGSYRETLSSTSISLKAFDSEGKLMEDKTKTFSFAGSDLEIMSVYYNVWKTHDKNSLIEIEFYLYNSGDCPAFPEKIKINYNDQIYESNILPCTILPKKYNTTQSFVYIDNINFGDDLTLEIFDKDSNLLTKEEMKFENIKYCETAIYSAGLDNSLSVPVPSNLFSYYNTHEKLIIDDYSAFVFDKYDDDYIDLFMDLFIENLDYGKYFHSRTDPEKINEVAGFVQYLDYIPDYDEGEEIIEDPQYPIESLFRNHNDGGGDCEDKAILISSLLSNLGYDVSLIRIPDHMAVGVNLSEDALSYDYYTDNYYFLDTSPQRLGIVFSKYKNPSEIEVYSIDSRPFIDHTWKNSSLTIYSSSDGKKLVKVVSYIENLGNIKAEDLKIDALFYKDNGLEIKKESATLLEIEPHNKKKATLEIEVPSGTSCWFDTRIYMNDELVSKKTSDKKFTG